MFKKILIPIDGSQQANDALLKGLEIAKIHGSKVEILHVTTFSEEYTPDMSVNENTFPQESATPTEWITEYMENIRQNNENMLDSALKYANKFSPSITIITKLLTGRAAENILVGAEEGNFDLIVIGCRGLGGFKELVLGSVSHSVVNGSKIPVLIVK